MKTKLIISIAYLMEIQKKMQGSGIIISKRMDTESRVSLQNQWKNILLEKND